MKREFHAKETLQQTDQIVSRCFCVIGDEFSGMGGGCDQPFNNAANATRTGFEETESQIRMVLRSGIDQALKADHFGVGKKGDQADAEADQRCFQVLAVACMLKIIGDDEA